MNCPLCLSKNIKFFHENTKGKFKFKYFNCNDCNLVFMDRNALLKASEESSRYLMHQNDKRTPGYENFLRELIKPVLERVSKKSLGLDYGSGPYPMMAQIIKEDGFQIDIYDPFFANDKSKLDKKYDFITCCEVVEHFHFPVKDFQLLNDLLKSNGILGVRTNILYPDIEFKTWHYKEDDTHVVFYTPDTINWICENYGFELIFLEINVFLLKKTTF